MDRGDLVCLYKCMTRSELIEIMASRFPQLNKCDVEFAVLAMLDVLNDAAVSGQRIEVRGFGSFSVKRRAPRMGRNPRNGDSVAVPEKRVLHFKPGKDMRWGVNQSTGALAPATADLD